MKRLPNRRQGLRRIRSRVLPFFGGMLLLTASSAGIAQPSTPQQAQTAVPSNTAASAESHAYRVLLINGHTGLPVAGGHVLLWYNDETGPGYTALTDAQGIALMPEPPAMPVRVLISAPNLLECRHHMPGSPPEGYNFQAIAHTGLSTGNTCKGPMVRPVPGELVFYVRPPHWYDGIFNQ